jgi:hypothetical protein
VAAKAFDGHICGETTDLIVKRQIAITHESGKPVRYHPLRQLFLIPIKSKRVHAPGFKHPQSGSPVGESYSPVEVADAVAKARAADSSGMRLLEPLALAMGRFSSAAV